MQNDARQSICLKSLAAAISAEQREIQRLRAENEQLRSDNALLKKYPPSCSRSLKILCGGLTVRRHFPNFPVVFR